MSQITSMIWGHYPKMSIEKLKIFDFKKLLSKIINDRLIIQEARALEMDREEFVINNLNEQKEKIAVKYLLKNSYSFKPQIDSNEVLKYFTKYYPRLQIRTISVMTKEGANDLIVLIREGAKMDLIKDQRLKRSIKKPSIAH